MKVISEETKTKIDELLANGEHAYLTVSKKAKTAGYLTELKRLFPNNFVMKYSSTRNGEKVWIYKIHAGNKEYHEMMNTEVIKTTGLLKGAIEQLKR